MDIDSDNHLVVQQEAIERLVGLVGERASTAMIRGMAQWKSSPPVRERRGLISHWEHTFRSEFNVNGTRTTLEVRLVHCIGSVLDLEAVYTLMRSTGLGLVVEIGRSKLFWSKVWK